MPPSEVSSVARWAGLSAGLGTTAGWASTVKAHFGVPVAASMA